MSFFRAKVRRCYSKITNPRTQIHIRTPSEGEDPATGGPTTASASLPSSDDSDQRNGQSSSVAATTDSNGRAAIVPPDPGRQYYSARGEDEQSCANDSGSSVTGCGANKGGTERRSGVVPGDRTSGGRRSGGETAGGVSTSGGLAGNLPSESFPPEVFYSMKLVAGKDAVGTLSGPGTLGIEPRGAASSKGIPGEAGSEVRGSTGGGVCGENGSGGVGVGGAREERRSTVQTLMDTLSWGRGELEVVAGKWLGGRGRGAGQILGRFIK